MIKISSQIDIRGSAPADHSARPPVLQIKNIAKLKNAVSGPMGSRFREALE